jgi:general secretion pathway protein B
MSYILDALRKADAERERGSVPDLHAQLLPLGSPEAEAEPPRSSPLIWLGVGVLLAVAGGVAWWALGDGEPAAPAPPTPIPLGQAPAAALPPPAPTLVPPPAGPAEAASPPQQASPRAEAAAPRPAPKAAAKPKAVASAPAALAPEPKPAKPEQAAPPPASPPAPPARLPSLAELPGELWQQVPPLVIGGSVYSPQASVRMVVVNGQVFQEGNSLAPELRLEQVRPKTAVFSIRGQRFEVPL